jgi:hypothetical protein
MRSRIVAAALTRPDLRALIARDQSRLTNELLRIANYGQQRGWMRRDVSGNSIAILMQAVALGRTMDDLALIPMSDIEWEQTLVAFFMEMMNVPVNTH